MGFPFSISGQSRMSQFAPDDGVIQTGGPQPDNNQDEPAIDDAVGTVREGDAVNERRTG